MASKSPPPGAKLSNEAMSGPAESKAGRANTRVLPPKACLPAPGPSPSLRARRVMKARRGSTCPACGGPVVVCQQIGLTLSGWLHVAFVVAIFLAAG